VITGFTNTD